MTTAQTYTAVRLAFLAILAIALPVLGIFSAKHVRRRGDPARSGILYLHISIWLFFASCILSIPSDAAFLSLHNINTYKALNHLSLVADFLHVLSTAALLVCMAQLAVGIKSAATQHAQRSPKLKLTISITTGVAVSCLLVYFGYWHYRLAVSSSDTRLAPAGIFAIVGLIGVLLLFIQAIGIFMFALILRKTIRKAAKHTGTRAGYAQIGKTLTIITGVNLAIFVWIGIVAILLGLSIGARPSAWIVGNLVFDYCGTFGLLLAIYYVGKAQEGGLWSSEGVVEANCLPLNSVGHT